MKRPWLVTFFCISTWLWLFILFPDIFSPQVKKIHLLLPSVYSIIVSFLFIASIGIWYMKKWGLEMFYVFLFLKTLLDNFTHKNTSPVHISFSFGFLFFFILGIIVVALYYKKMSKDL